MILKIIMGSIFILAFVAGIFLLLEEETNKSYQMPNGIVCTNDKSSIYSTKYINCQDGLVYINPPTVKIIIAEG